jgi:aryl-alcohol dehydrogenase-like predicted oxidoreductase
MTMMGPRKLGQSDVEVTPIGLGTWQFSGGRGPIAGYWGQVPQETVDGIVRASLDGGIDWFDTAEAYGWGASERALARALTAAGRKPGDVRIATKWWPALRRAASLRRTIDRRLERLDGFPIDLYQVHQPLSVSSVERQMDAMADLVRDGKIRAVGVSNFSAAAMRRAHAALAARGIPLASNQVPYSLLRRRIETDGILAAAKELGVTIIAYSPLAQGVLTGRFHEDPQRVKALRAPRRWMPAFRARGLAASRPLIDELRRIAEAHGATPAQVALQWLLAFHGDTVVAIPGATKQSHVEDNVGAMRLSLAEAEAARLDELSRPFLR